MESSRYSVAKVTFLLAFIIMASEMGMKLSEARGPIARLPCDNDKECQVGCRNPFCGCGSVCINNVCQCPPPISTNNVPNRAPHP
uniref:Uncharacterized protein n=1 Tax=Cajanus cajan TaxID=3821 RepID=A0A151SWA2_CAJCA|nr:hypothetical protein KK1_014500 [Cajanus cajan]